jgi:RNA polymerase sigma-70 factor, ECF subfamily
MRMAAPRSRGEDSRLYPSRGGGKRKVEAVLDGPGQDREPRRRARLLESVAREGYQAHPARKRFRAQLDYLAAGSHYQRLSVQAARALHSPLEICLRRPAATSASLISARTLDALFAASKASQWDVTLPVFAAAVSASVEHRFPESGVPNPESRVTGAADAEEIEAFVRSLHVEDLALACACRAGHERAWEHFIRELRPSLYAAARGVVRGGSANDLVDSLFADLYGLTGRDGERRPLIAYYHGRARLTTWLRTVLVQRHVDAIRASARTVPLDEDRPSRQPSPIATPVDPRAADRVALAQSAFDAAVARLDPRDRLRLRLYYGQDLTLARIGKVLGEHEATVSRKLEKTRGQLKTSVESALRRNGLSDEQLRACLSDAASSPAIDISAALVDEER